MLGLQGPRGGGSKRDQGRARERERERRSERESKVCATLLVGVEASLSCCRNYRVL